MSSVKPGFGWESYMQFAKETAWGTFPTIDHRMPVSKMNPRPDISRIRPRSLNGSLAQPPVLAPLTRGLFTLEIPMTYNGLGLLLDAIMGTATIGNLGGVTTGPVSNLYTHTWAGFLAVLPSNSFELGMGNITLNRVEKLIGFKISKATFRLSTSSLASEDTIGTLTLEMVGKSVASNIDPTNLGTTAPTVDAAGLDYVMGSHMTVNTNSSGTLTERTIDWQLEIDNMISMDRFFMEGTGAISEPIRKARPKVTMTVTEEFQTRTSLDAYLANTKTTIETKFLSSNAKSFFDFVLKGAIMQAPEHPVEGDDFLRQKLVYEAEDAGTGQTLAMVNGNLMATIAATS